MPLPCSPREPIRSLVLKDGFGDDGMSYVGAEINAAGALVISAVESAPLCEAMRGDLDAESWLTIAPTWKDELLLRLLAERFSARHELVRYLEQHGIPVAAQTA
jgi:hypothetical protein